jgi:hypothetical protein
VLVNGADPAVAAKLEHEIAHSPVARTVYDALAADAERFELDPAAAGLDVRSCSVLPNGIPNRARVKIFSPRPGSTLIFFYKRSLVPYSRDRYSYGGIDLKGTPADPHDIAAWIAFVSSGFHPDTRPANLRRAFPYEIPE